MFKKAKPLKKPDDAEHAYDYALFLLNIRLRTEGELRKKMRERGYVQEVIDSVASRLKDDRLIDDERYAEIYLDNMKSYKQYGFYQMKKKLMEKLLPIDLIENKLEEFVSESDEKKIAKKYLAKEYGEMENIAGLEYAEKQKIMRRMLARGFRMNVVTKLVK